MHGPTDSPDASQFFTGRSVAGRWLFPGGGSISVRKPAAAATGTYFGPGPEAFPVSTAVLRPARFRW
jgi:hypothetical protein